MHDSDRTEPVQPNDPAYQQFPPPPGMSHTGPFPPAGAPHTAHMPAPPPPTTQQQYWGPPAAMPGMYQPAPHQQVVAKSPALALLASFFIPGLGTLINGQVGKAVVIFVGYLICWLLWWLLLPLLGVFAFWVWGMVDAYTSARDWNAAHGIVS